MCTVSCDHLNCKVCWESLQKPAGEKAYRAANQEALQRFEQGIMWSQRGYIPVNVTERNVSREEKEKEHLSLSATHLKVFLELVHLVLIPNLLSISF